MSEETCPRWPHAPLCETAKQTERRCANCGVRSECDVADTEGERAPTCEDWTGCPGSEACSADTEARVRAADAELLRRCARGEPIDTWATCKADYELAGVLTPEDLEEPDLGVSDTGCPQTHPPDLRCKLLDPCPCKDWATCVDERSSQHADLVHSETQQGQVVAPAVEEGGGESADLVHSETEASRWHIVAGRGTGSLRLLLRPRPPLLPYRGEVNKSAVPVNDQAVVVNTEPAPVNAARPAVNAPRLRCQRADGRCSVFGDPCPGLDACQEEIAQANACAGATGATTSSKEAVHG